MGGSQVGEMGHVPSSKSAAVALEEGEREGRGLEAVQAVDPGDPGSVQGEAGEGAAGRPTRGIRLSDRFVRKETEVVQERAEFEGKRVGKRDDESAPEQHASEDGRGVIRFRLPVNDERRSGLIWIKPFSTHPFTPSL
jgi:hypothetical protein